MSLNNIYIYTYLFMKCWSDLDMHFTGNVTGTAKSFEGMVYYAVLQL